jgi:hypothetical protein
MGEIFLRSPVNSVFPIYMSVTFGIAISPSKDTKLLDIPLKRGRIVVGSPGHIFI